ncbi:MAG: HAD family phosphatase [Candidatus Dojkabacteria bacterium]|nr:HAD family phosphatase [Candidatus Dojkabacteria bacterium]
MIKNETLLKEQIKRTTTYIFDLDGTVVDLENLNFDSFRRAIEEQVCRKLTWDEYQTYISGRGSRAGLQAYLSAQVIDTGMAEEIQKRFWTFKEETLKTRFSDVVTVMPGIRELLSLLRAKSRRTCLATSSGPQFTSLILNGTALNVFDRILTRQDVDNTKPAPDIFLHALAELHSRAETSIVFEDSHSGIEAAQRSGIFTVGVVTPGRNESYTAKADALITSYLDILEAVKTADPMYAS